MNQTPSAADWERLGELLTRRRVDLDPRFQNRTVFAEERGLNYRLAYDIEEAKRSNFRPATLAAIASAYAVTAESVSAVLRGDGELEPLPADAPRITAVPAPVPPGATLSAIDRIAALIATATPAELEILDATVEGIVAGDEVLEMMWSAPSRHHLGELMPREQRLRMILLWLRDDPRRALDDEGRRGTGTA